MKGSDTMLAAGGTQVLSGWRKQAAGPECLKSCSLVVPTYKRPVEIVALLDRLRVLSPGVPDEVVVVDGSPDTEAEEAVRRWVGAQELPFQLSYVRSPRGLTLQRNVGIDAAGGDVVFFLDDDCLPFPGYFETILRVFDADLEQKVGGVCGTAVAGLNQPLPLRWRLRFRLGLVPSNWPAGKYFPTAISAPATVVKSFSGTRPTDILSGCAMAWRREVFREHRFSRFFYGYSQGEDVEMSLRVGRSWRLLWCGDAHVDHRHVPGGRPRWAEKGRMEVCNRHFIWKNHTPHPTFGIRVRFWGDIAYIFLWDLGAFLAHPKKPQYLAHALGMLRGVVSCLVSPPVFREAPAQREYRFSLCKLATNASAASAPELNPLVSETTQP